jgi:hypothetical protein
MNWGSKVTSGDKKTELLYLNMSCIPVKEHFISFEKYFLWSLQAHQLMWKSEVGLWTVMILHGTSPIVS